MFQKTVGRDYAIKEVKERMLSDLLKLAVSDKLLRSLDPLLRVSSLEDSILDISLLTSGPRLVLRRCHSE